MAGRGCNAGACAGRARGGLTLSLSLVCLMQSIDFGRMSLQLSRLRGVNTSLLTELNNMKAHLRKLGPAQPQQAPAARHFFCAVDAFRVRYATLSS